MLTKEQLATAFADIDHARRVLAYSDSAVLRSEAEQYITDHETKAEQRMERWMGWDD
jgi:hypothetical protein